MMCRGQIVWFPENENLDLSVTLPPKGATDVKTSKGSKSADPPLGEKIESKTIDYYKRIKNKLLKILPDI